MLAAVDGYRNDAGGYGWGLEPDLRAPESQPGCALHAFEVFEDLAPVTTPRVLELCDWLDSVTLPDGGLPFALPVADPTVSTLQSTAFAAGAALRVAAHDRYPAAPPLPAQLAQFVPDTGRVPVEGGSEGETMRALNFAPVPGSPASALLGAGVIDAELDELAAQQQDDGGWTVDFASYSPAAALEWCGHATVGALLTLKRAGRLQTR